MAEYDNRVRSYGAADAAAIDVGLRAYMLRVYNYMLMGLGLTGLTAWFTASVPAFSNLFFQITGRGYTLSLLGWVVLLAPLGLVFFLSFRIQKMSFAAAQATFWVYAGLMGIGLDARPAALHGCVRGAGVLRHRRHLRRDEPLGLHHQAGPVRPSARSCSWG